MRPTGIEPVTSRTSSGRSSQLSYDRISAICRTRVLYTKQNNMQLFFINFPAVSHEAYVRVRLHPDRQKYSLPLL